MTPELVMAKIEGGAQAAQVNAMAGKSFTIGKVTAAEKGFGSWLFMTPQGAAGTAGQGTVAVKLEGTRQLAELSSLVGKSVTVGKSPAIAGNLGNWLVLHPNAAVAANGAAAAGAAGKGLAGSQMVMMKLEGATQAAQMPMLTGKTFTVAAPQMAGTGASNWLFLKPAAGTGLAGQEIIAIKVQNGAFQLPALIGKTVTVGKAPLVAGNAGKWMVLHTGAGATGKAVTGAAAAKGFSMAGAFGKGAATKAAAGKSLTGAAGKSLAATAAAKSVASGGTIWTGTGLSLGLGLGLGAFGPLLLGGVIVAAGYGYYRRLKNQDLADTDFDEAIGEAAT